MRRAGPIMVLLLAGCADAPAKPDPAAKAEVKTEAKPEAQAEAKTDAKVEAKADAKAETGHLVPAKVVPKELPEIYDEKGDMRAALDTALAAAKKDDRRVLTVFGGNWCTWCHKLHMLFERHEAIHELLAASYVVLKIDSNTNEKLIAELGIKLEGVPFLAVMDGDGNILVKQETGSLEEGPRHDPAKVLAFLGQWKSAPEQP